MKKKKIKYIDWLLSVYHFFKPTLKKGVELNSDMQFQRIVIYSTTALGDLMFNTPAIAALKQRYPDADIVLVSSQKNSQLVDNSPWFSRVIYWDNKIRDIYPVIKELRDFKPQLTVILHSHMMYDLLCAVFSGTEYIIRDNYHFDSDSNRLLPWLNRYHTAYNGHLIQRKLDLIASLGCDSSAIEMQIPVAFERAVDDGVMKIGFQIGASEMKRCWPLQRFVELAQLLVRAYPQCQIIVLGGKKEALLEPQFLSLLPSEIRPNIISMAGKTSLLGLLTVIDSLDVLVTGDTGPLHLAIAIKTPTVSLYADAEPQYTGPYQDRDQHCILKIAASDLDKPQPLSVLSAERVFQEVTALLSQKSPVE